MTLINGSCVLYAVKDDISKHRSKGLKEVVMVLF